MKDVPPAPPGATRVLRVALVDDARPLREALRQLLDGTPGFRCVGAFASAEEALRADRALAPEVILLDVDLPGRSGPDSVADLLARFPGALILMLTVFDEHDRIFTSLANGACGYLLKRTPPARLLEAIEEAYQGGSPMSPEIARQVIRVLQRHPVPTLDGARLTPQQLRLLACLADGHSYQAAARELGVSVNTVREHVRAIYDKLHVHSKSAAVSKAMRAGLI